MLFPFCQCLPDKTVGQQVRIRIASAPVLAVGIDQAKGAAVRIAKQQDRVPWSAGRVNGNLYRPAAPNGRQIRELSV